MLERPSWRHESEGAELCPQADRLAEGRAENRRVVAIARDILRATDAVDHVMRGREEFDAERIGQEDQMLLHPIADRHVLAECIATLDSRVLDDAARRLDHQRVGESLICETAHPLQRLHCAEIAAEDCLPKDARHRHPERRTPDTEGSVGRSGTPAMLTT